MSSTRTDVAAIVRALAGSPVAVVRDGDDVIVGAEPAEIVVADAANGFEALDRAARAGYWIGALSYDVGRAVERVSTRRADDVGFPDVVLARFDARIVCAPGRPAEVVGRGSARRVLERAIADAHDAPEGAAAVRPEVDGVAAWESSLDQAAHAARVETIKQLLRAGECYQVNLTRRLTSRVGIDPIALFAAIHERHHAPHEALLALGKATSDIALVSASPELFLRVDGRRVETRPIKGTAADAGALRASAKDRAENVMIVDLARNDFGRVCEPGSIHVPSLLAVEPHPGLHHLVSTVTGQLRAGISLGTLLRATFPAASITGAPKPRVMQAIEDLEPVRRGAYCGSIGWIDAARGASKWSVAIRTFVVTPSAIHLGVGGGIVADSDAGAEWAETELKAARLLSLVPDAAAANDTGAMRVLAGGRA